jgi:hypothetical protein
LLEKLQYAEIENKSRKDLQSNADVFKVPEICNNFADLETFVKMTNFSLSYPGLFASLEKTIRFSH